MGRKSMKEPRQKEIIRAFYKLSKKEGLENASIAKTADLAGINPSLVMHYFETKEHLVYGLVEYILDKYLLIFKVPTAYEHQPKKKLLAVLENIFSKKWNTLFDDGVSYSCYSLNFRNQIIKEKFKAVLDALRYNLESIIQECMDTSIVKIKSAKDAADMIFVLVDGSYYYLSLITNKAEYARKLKYNKQRAFDILQFKNDTASLK